MRPCASLYSTRTLADTKTSEWCSLMDPNTLPATTIPRLVTTLVQQPYTPLHRSIPVRYYKSVRSPTSTFPSFNAPFHFDNCSRFPVISRHMASNWKVPIHCYSDGLTLFAGHLCSEFTANYFCILYICLHADNTIRLTPFIVSENISLHHLLIPTAQSPLA